jgi:hypothetical protein
MADKIQPGSIGWLSGPTELIAFSPTKVMNDIRVDESGKDVNPTCEDKLSIRRPVYNLTPTIFGAGLPIFADARQSLPTIRSGLERMSAASRIAFS